MSQEQVFGPVTEDSRPLIDLWISPCPNDTWIFGPLIHDLIAAPWRFRTHFADVQTLNTYATQGMKDLIKISYGTWPLVKENYCLLNCGGAMGKGCGPLLLGQKDTTGFDPDCETVLPGAGTTARYLFEAWFRFHYPQYLAKVRYASFDAIYEGLLDGSIQQGVAIHECRFKWQSDGLFCASDLGEFWEGQSQGPIPLGGILLDPKFEDQKELMEEWIRKSILWSQNNPQVLMNWIREMAQIPDESVVLAHVHTYVNSYSLDIGDDGRAAIQFLERIHHA